MRRYRYCIAILLLFAAAASYGDDWSDWTPWKPAPGHGGSWPGAPRPVLKVFDANGRVVGRLAVYTGYNDLAYSYDGVYLTVDGSVTFARIERTYDAAQFNLPSRNQFAWSVTPDVDYESANCSGAPVIGYRRSGPRPSVAVREGTDTILYVGGGGNTHPTAHGSHLQFIDNANQCTPGSAGQMDDGNVQAQSSIVLTRRYPEPLTVGF
jgi:hypothetical protein